MFSVDFRNEKPELRYDEEELESYKDYADLGGGHWTLGVLQKNNSFIITALVMCIISSTLLLAINKRK